MRVLRGDTDAATGHRGLMDDTDALNDIRDLLDGTEWDADTVDAVAELVRRTGRLVRDVVSGPAPYRITYVGVANRISDAAEEVFHDADDARTAFAQAVLTPREGLGMITLWSRDGGSEWGLVAFCDLVRLGDRPG